MVSLGSRGRKYLCVHGRDADGVRDHKRRHLLLDRDDLTEGNDKLLSATAKVTTYISDPAKDVGMEANVVLRYVDSALHENVLGQCTPIV